jgi:hypothetical protein
MGPGAGCGEHRPQGALTAGFDVAAGGLAEDRDVAAQPVRQFPVDPAQSVGTGLDLLAVVQDQRDVVNRLVEGRGQVQEHRVTGLHVRGAATVDMVGVAPGRHVVRDRHGVEMSGQDHPRRAAEIGAGQHRVAVADDLIAGLLAQGGLDLVGDPAFVARNTGNVDQRGGQHIGVRAQIQHN